MSFVVPDLEDAVAVKPQEIRMMGMQNTVSPSACGHVRAIPKYFRKQLLQDTSNVSHNSVIL